MHTLTWKHTRKNTPMNVKGTMGQLLIRIMIVRSVYPNYPMFIDGKLI